MTRHNGRKGLQLRGRAQGHRHGDAQVRGDVAGVRADDVDCFGRHREVNQVGALGLDADANKVECTVMDMGSIHSKSEE